MKTNKVGQSLSMNLDLYPVVILVFFGVRRLGIRLRRVRGLMGREEGKVAVESGMDLQIQSLRCYQLGHLAFTHF